MNSASEDEVSVSDSSFVLGDQMVALLTLPLHVQGHTSSESQSRSANAGPQLQILNHPPRIPWPGCSRYGLYRALPAF